MSDRQHESSSPFATGAAPRMLADRAPQVREFEPIAASAPIPAIGFSLLGLASRIESWPTPGPSAR